MNESNYIIAHWFVSDIKQSRVSKINRITFEILPGTCSRMKLLIIHSIYIHSLTSIIEYVNNP